MDIPPITPDEIIPALERRVAVARSDADVTLCLSLSAPSVRSTALAQRARDELIAAETLLVIVRAKMTG